MSEVQHLQPEELQCHPAEAVLLQAEVQQDLFPITEDLLHPITPEAVLLQADPARKAMTEVHPQDPATAAIPLQATTEAAHPQAGQATAAVHLQADQAMAAARPRATTEAVRQVVPAGQVEVGDKQS